MLLSRLSARLLVTTSMAFLAIAGGPVLSRSSAATVAATSNFHETAAKLPDSASTAFYEPLWSNGDPLNTAEHELFHAIGFTVAYTNFASHVQAAIAAGNPNAGDRPFNSKTDGTGTTLALLTPASDGTHVDPGAGTVNGRNQNLSIMQPNLVNGQRLAAWEAQILNSAFAWDTLNIQIKVVYATAFTNAQKTSITGAVDAVQTLFGSNGTGTVFTWTVSVVPEPSSYVMMTIALVTIVGIQCRRGFATPLA